MFKKILIANRGEIAVRIIRACRELGIKSAAVYSDADKTSIHTRLADESYYIGESTPSSSYLNKEKLLNLAKTIHADAVHPGYGFLSENSGFIKLLEDNGITFIGPSSESVAMMGSKTAARELMIQNGVPIVPGTTVAITSTEEGKKEARNIGYPVLLKAAAGGGGKGMRKVVSDEEFNNSFEAAQREAIKAFGSDEVYIEKYIENPRHIEVQIIADQKGNYAHIFERECSIQRRHQKIIEESPSSFVDDATRECITTAAINAGKACGYYNAGTVEFLMDSNKDFYFLEMNTRLQVEHPVTELISGIDLVKEQISIAYGNQLSFKQEDLKINGHALECRIYAEDPEENFLPAIGTLFEYKIPSGPGVRVDDGFGLGSVISVYYDALIAKLVCWADNRSNAVTRMRRALNEFDISGVITNIPFLKVIMDDENFAAGNININFIENGYKKLLQALEIENNSGNLEDVASVFAALLKNELTERKNGKTKNNSINKNNWNKLSYE